MKQTEFNYGINWLKVPLRLVSEINAVVKGEVRCMSLSKEVLNQLTDFIELDLKVVSFEVISRPYQSLYVGWMTAL